MDYILYSNTLSHGKFQLTWAGSINKSYSFLPKA
uniref:Uncharacterized protein n=1 Tax=Rhizophora mucronata TaxID=61149 RepID=A0A2P2NC98_RHIMU